MPYTDAGKNAMLDALGVTHAAIFNGDPSAAGTQIGTRQAITFDAATGGAKSQDGTAVQFTVPGGSTVDHVGYYDAATGGTLLAFDAVTPETFGGDGTYTLSDTDFTISD